MIRVHRALVASALLGGAVLLSVAPASAQPQPTDLRPVGNAPIATGSADLDNFFCGTLWRPVCYPDGLPS
ncbi:hypothetical protein [Nocardia caishijiensis]|uniref:Uncharacterized protein n=1 Tax=Nocardia caishijiensis TaxID=184756 RepID=A0ABQ6YRQ4_9NOCA|nr:hypothetical protein [Nocardia caishijiensis]KAF0848131.1 hypothetical protein FNL39_102278 [Nocardia caishijiensis]